MDDFGESSISSQGSSHDGKDADFISSTLQLWKLVSPPVLVLVAALGWGTLSMLQGTATTFARAMVCRLVLGIFEALFAPGIPLFLVSCERSWLTRQLTMAIVLLLQS